MTEAEVIDRVNAAERELKPLFDFINSGSIVPNDGCLSYTHGTALLRANDMRKALTDLMVHAMAHARHRNAVG